MKSGEWDFERTFTSSGHPGAEHCGAIGSTLAETLGMDSIEASPLQNDGKQKTPKKAWPWGWRSELRTESLDESGMLRVESGEWDSERTFTSSGHPGAKQCEAIGSTQFCLDSIGSFRASRMTVNRRLPKKRGPGGGCKEGGPWPSQLGKVPLPCHSPGRRTLRRQAETGRLATKASTRNVKSLSAESNSPLCVSKL